MEKEQPLPEAKIRIEEQDGTVSVTAQLDQVSLINDSFVLPEGQQSLWYTLLSILNSLKPVFYKMPILLEDKDIAFHISGQFYDKYKDICAFVPSVMIKTNEAVMKFKSIGNMTGHCKKTLFYNVNHFERFIGFYEQCRKMAPDQAIYKNMKTGWDHLTRNWTLQPDYLQPSALFDLIQAEEIKRMVSVNMYYLTMVLREQNIYLPAVLRKAGVEYVMMDYDFYDLAAEGYLLKAFFSCESFTRFTVSPYMHQYWDDRFKLKNIHYVANPQSYGDQRHEGLHQLADDYSVIVLSHSRLSNLLSDLERMLYLFERFKEHFFLTELQLWYYSLRHLILENFELSDYDRMYYNTCLHAFFINCISFIKYEVIDSITANRKVEIYGDVQWDHLFPQYYTKKYLNHIEKDELMSNRRGVQLLFNHNYSYLENNPVILGTLKKNMPFITLPALVKTVEFQGFRHLEYNDKNELNQLIENINSVNRNDELKQAIAACRNISMESCDEMGQYLMSDRTLPKDGGSFYRHSLEHKKKFDQMIHDHLKSYEPFIIESFKVLFLGKPTVFDVTQSKFFHRDYVQRIIQFKTQK